MFTFHDNTVLNCVLRCVFDLSTARWSRAPTPQINTCFQFYGICRDVSPSNILRIKLESVAINLGGSNASTSAPSATVNQPSTGATPVTPKKRKFSPSPLASSDVAPPVPPITSESNIFAGNPQNPNAAPSTTMIPGGVPMHYAQLFQQYHPYSPPTSFPGPLPPFFPQQNLYSMPSYSPFNPSSPYNAAGEYVKQSLDPRLLPPATADANSLFAPGNPSIPADTERDSAFNRSAADPCRYPMTQMCAVLIFFQLAEPYIRLLQQSIIGKVSILIHNVRCTSYCKIYTPLHLQTSLHPGLARAPPLLVLLNPLRQRIARLQPRLPRQRLSEIRRPAHQLPPARVTAQRLALFVALPD